MPRSGDRSCVGLVRFDGTRRCSYAAQGAAQQPELEGCPTQSCFITRHTSAAMTFEPIEFGWMPSPASLRASANSPVLPSETGTATSGDHEAMLRQMVAQQRIHAVIVDALRGARHAPALRREPALRVATVLTMVWFANLTAWGAGIIDEAILVDIVRQSADMLLHGVQPQ
jgi:hypothetical protein